MQSSVVAHAIARAATLLGGVDELAHKLNVSPGVVRVWLSGNLEVPPRVFLQVVDIISAAESPATPPDVTDGSANGKRDPR